MKTRRRPMSAVMALALTFIAGAAGCTTPTTGAKVVEQVVSREFGIASDPWQVDDWEAAVGARPTMVMEFEQWSRGRTIDNHFAAARERGLRSFVISWEPWKSVPPELGKDAQHAEQTAFSNAAIASGAHDDYIRSFARSVAKSQLTVYMRYAHEMNGDWYPWSREPAMYAQAWRHVHDIFVGEGASNARWVFSLNPTPYEGETSWSANAQAYWPGPQYVDYVGSTMINFGGTKEKSVAEFAERLSLMRELFGKDVLITEANAAAFGRVKWFTDLRTYLMTEAPWIIGVVLSQHVSRGKVQLGRKVGDLAWNVTTDPATRPVIKALIEDLTSAPAPA